MNQQNAKRNKPQFVAQGGRKNKYYSRKEKPQLKSQAIIPHSHSIGTGNTKFVITWRCRYAS